MDSSIYTIWLTNCIGQAYKRSKAVMEAFESSEQIFRADERELRLSGLFTNSQMARLMNKSDIDIAKRIYNRAGEVGDRIITAASSEYPECFRELSDPPFLIFVRGKLPAQNAVCAGMVGTREPGMAGKQTAFDISYNLAKNNVVIVSGGAKGIDTQAHKGAVLAGGITICVLGCGTNASYNMENASLRKEITRNGALITEYPPDTMPTEYTFPMRNRLIAALSDCCIVVEGGLSSGSLITAAKSAEMSKRIFAVPGSIDDTRYMGSNMLLAAGALAALSHRDILKWYTGAHRDVKAGYIDAREIEGIRKLKPRDLKMDSVFIPGGERARNSERMADKKSLSKASYKTAAVNEEYNKTEELPAEAHSQKGIINKKTENTSPQNEKNKNIFPGQLTTNAKSVYDTISGTPRDADTISSELGMEISTVLSALTELEIFGLIELCGYGRYKRRGQ